MDPCQKKATRKQLETVLYNLLEGLRIVSGLIYPVMPHSAKKMQTHLGLDPQKPFYHFDVLNTWKALESGTIIPKAISLFPRIDTPASAMGQLDKDSSDTTPAAIKPEIPIEIFSQVDLRIGTVTNAEAIPKAKKLLKLEVDIGESRTIVAGIAEYYAPHELIGRQVIIVANLKPAKLMGILSRGMLMAAVDDNQCTLATPDRKTKPGTQVY